MAITSLTSTISTAVVPGTSKAKYLHEKAQNLVSESLQYKWKIDGKGYNKQTGKIQVKRENTGYRDTYHEN